MNGTVFISAKGGDASLTGGGGGSGGRIKFYFFQWYNVTLAKDMASNLNVTTMLVGGPGGTADQVGDNGTVWSTDCPPGYEGLFCSKCLPGYYKNEYSNIACKKCQSMPKQA